MSPEPDLLDVVGAQSRMAGVECLYPYLWREFLVQLRAVVPHYRRALLAGVNTETANQMHTLKGMAATLGANRLSQRAAELQALCQSTDRINEALAEADCLQSLIDSTGTALECALLGVDVAPIVA